MTAGSDRLPEPDRHAFPSGGGELGRLIAGFDWSRTSLGPIEGWPAEVKAVVAIMLRSAVPIVTLWGEPGVMIYNDAYSVFAGRRHPALLGSDVREGWPEVADFNDNIVKSVFRRGESLSYKDQELTLRRGAAPAQAWMNLDYSPVLDSHGVPIGVIAIVVETTEKVLADRRLRGEYKRLAQMYEQSPSFMALLEGPEHVVVLANAAYHRLIGDREVLGKTIREALPDAVEQGYLARLDSVFESGEAYITTGARYGLQTEAGGPVTERFVDFVFQPITGDDGSVTGIFIDGVDVTERVRAQAAIEASETQFRSFAQAMPNHVWTAPPDGQLDWFNQRVYDYSGSPPGSLGGSNWTRIVHPDDVEAAGALWAAALASGETYETEFRIRRADGDYLWHLVRALPIRDADGRITRWIGSNTDIDERKAAEVASVRDRERAWRLSPVVKLIATTAGEIGAVNPSWTALLGWSAEETVGRNILEFVDPGDVEAPARLERLADATGVVEGRSAFVARSGERLRFAWTTVPEGGMLYIFGRDITAETEAADALAAAEDALRQSQKMEAVGQLTGGIAHDFNNLLQGITGSLDLIQRRIVQGRTGDLDRFLTGAMSAANRASALTHRLLAFSRRQPLDPRAVRVNPLIGSMEDLLRRTLGERIDLELVLAGGLWPTLCDPNQLENAVLNLAINARDAMPDGGKLTIETCNAHLDSAYAAKLRDVAPGQYVCLCVTDTGTGMSAETITRAFEPFFTTKPIGQGTGLGLSMIYGFARQSEGHAKIYSEVGKGTTFKLYLPRHRGAVADGDDAIPEITHAHRAHGETVLVIEDEPIVRGLIVEVLDELGYGALEAADGPSGLAMLQSKRSIDLLITDIGLPGLNGRQVADAGRALRPGLKVLFMTGYAENAALASGFLEPGMTMITKPFAMEALATKIREIVATETKG